MLRRYDYVAHDDASHQPAPEDKAGSAHHRAYVVHQDRVVKLAAEEAADHCGEGDVAHGLGIVTAARELPLRDDLPDDERHEHRQSESRELERTDIIRERLLNYRSENFLHRA